MGASVKITDFIGLIAANVFGFILNVFAKFTKSFVFFNFRLRHDFTIPASTNFPNGQCYSRIVYGRRSKS